MNRVHRTWARTFFLAAALTITWSPLRAKSIPPDDSGSQALEPSVSMHWKSTQPSRSRASNLMVGSTTIRIRINVLPWLRHAGRIYLVLPAQSPGRVTASWVTQGRLLPGQLQSGSRVLVYAGPITSPFIEDVVRFQFGVDGKLLDRAFPVTYHFEMDEG